tara:strand:+ start:444 stop:953 length:510 start_codon:yes stop_codon:yes gene_type:complete
MEDFVNVEPEPAIDTIEPIAEDAIAKTGIRAVYTEDPRMNYLFGSEGVKEDMDAAQNEIIMVDDNRIDYAIKEVSGLDTEELPVELDQRDTVSFMSVNSIDEGIEWYKQNFPKVPEELYPVMARWNWGDLKDITKKDVKNDKKRIKQGKKPKVCDGLTSKQGNFIVSFD